MVYMGIDVGTIAAGVAHGTTYGTTHGHMMDGYGYGWAHGAWLFLAALAVVGLLAVLVFIALTERRQ